MATSGSQEPSPDELSPERVLEAYRDALDAGTPLDLDEWIARHPGLAEDLLTEYSRWEGEQSVLGDLGFSEAVEADTSRQSRATGLRERLLERLAERHGVLGRYRIGREIGRGGMGTVFEVWDQDLRRRLAMKIIRADGRSATPRWNEGQLARFVEEAQVSGQLEHPGIVPVHELGVDEEGQIFFTMRLVKGRTLAELLRGEEDEWTQVRVLNVLLRVCEAVAFAHSKGVVHRDLKPSNVMVGDYGEVYVLDWGLAKLLEGDGETIDPPGSPDPITSDRREHHSETPSSHLLTDAGIALGTAMYCSPEQARGERERIGEPSDVYSVGAMLYEVLAGRPPYVGRDESPSRDEVFERVRKGRLEPLARVSPNAPAELVAICDRAMAREIADRFQRMDELGAQLSAFLEGRVVEAYETGFWPETRKWILRNKGFAFTAAAAVMALILGLGASTHLWSEERSRAAEVEKERNRLSSVIELQNEVFGRLDPSSFGARLRRGVRDQAHALRSAEAGVPDSEHSEELALESVNFTDIGVSALANEILEPARDQVNRMLDRDAITRAQLLSSIARTYQRWGMYEPAHEILRESMSLYALELDDADSRVLEDRSAVCAVLHSLGDLDGALSCFEGVLATRRGTLGEGHPDTLASKNNVGMALSSMGRFDEALTYFTEVLDKSRALLGDEHPGTLASVYSLGVLYEDMGRSSDALPLLLQALDARIRLLGEEDPLTIETMLAVGAVLQSLSRFDEALPYHEEVLARSRHVFGENHPDTVLALNNLGALKFSMGRLDEVLPLALEVLDRWRRAYGIEHPLTLNAMVNVGAVLQGLGRLDEALPYYVDVLDISRRVLGPEHPDTLMNMDGLGGLYLSMGRAEEALALLEPAMDVSRRVIGPDHPAALSMMNTAAMALQDLGQFDRATQLQRDVLAILRREFGDDHSNTLTALNNMGTLLRTMGRYDEALAAFVEVLERGEAIFGIESAATLLAQHNVGSVLQDLGRPEEALLHMRNALDARRRTLGDEHPDTITSATAVGALYSSVGRHAEALAMLEETLALAERALGVDHPATLSIIRLLGEALERSGRLDLALERCRAALERTVERLGPNHLETVACLDCMGKVLHRMEQNEEALAHLRAALDRSEGLLGPAHPRTLARASRLGAVLVDSAHFEEARPILEAAVETAETSFPGKPADCIELLEALALCYDGLTTEDSAGDFRALAEQARERIEEAR